MSTGSSDGDWEDTADQQLPTAVAIVLICVGAGLIALLFLFISNRYRLRVRKDKGALVPSDPVQGTVELDEPQVSGEDDEIIVPIADDDKL